jgi:hypothetical protein
MAQLLRGTGLVAILAGIVLLLVREKLGGTPAAGITLLSAGAAAVVVGMVLAVASRARAAVVHRKCARCSRPVHPGEVYCTEHFREAVDQARDQQER